MKKPKDNSRDLFFGGLLILDSIKKIGDTLGWLSAKPKVGARSVSVIPTESDNSFPLSPFRLHIKYMTEAEVMEYLISTKN